MNDRHIDDVLRRAAERSPKPDQAAVARIAAALSSSLSPVRPLPSQRVLTYAMLLICAAAGLFSAGVLGLYGIHALALEQAALIFLTLAALAWLAAAHTAAEMIPGAAWQGQPWRVPVASLLILSALFGVLFHDYRTDHFVDQGLVCLKAGLAVAAPAGLLCWIVLRRGCIVHPASAGLAAGTLAGFAGVIMLEMHCANLQTFHVMLWHTAVIPVSGGLGALLGKIAGQK
jgi:hypothetical protein